MKNCEMKLDGNILTITVDISKGICTSSYGKSTLLLARMMVTYYTGEEDIKIGLNV